MLKRVVRSLSNAQRYADYAVDCSTLQITTNDVSSAMTTSRSSGISAASQRRCMADVAAADSIVSRAACI